MKRLILDLCAGSGAWSEPYVRAGYDVKRIELTQGQDVRFFQLPKREKVWGILAAPPCTQFSAAGARYWQSKGDAALVEGFSTLDACLRIVTVAQPVWWALENPRGRLTDYLGKPALTFQPWEYGDAWTKFTCLWGRFAVPLRSPVQPLGSKMNMVTSRKDRAALQAVTAPGFARAFFQANP